MTTSAGDIDAEVERGFEKLKQGALGAADAACAAALAFDPDHPEALRLAGLIDLQSGDPVAAVERFSRALSFQPHSATLHFNLGIAYEHLDDAADADASYAEAIRLRPDLGAAYRRAADLALRGAAVAAGHGLPDTAKALRLGACRYLTTMGAELVRRTLWLDAERAFREASRLAPDDARILTDLGRCLFELGRRDDSVAVLRQATTLDPDLTDPRHWLDLIFRS